MNSFEWQNKLSKFLDGNLPEQEQNEAEKFAASNPELKSRLEHYRQILETLKTSKPANISVLHSGRKKNQKEPPKKDSPPSQTRWQKTPWYIRTSVEGGAIAIVVALAIGFIPKIHSLYQDSMKRRLNSFEITELSPSSREDFEGVNFQPEEEAYSEIPSEEQTLDDEIEKSTQTPPPVRVGRSQIWRFTIKTPSPELTQTEVIKVFERLEIPPDTPGLSGVVAPGGIQFILHLPIDIVGDLKIELEKLAEPSNTDGGIGKSFSWFKNRGRRGIPAGKSRVVIWLSQI